MTITREIWQKAILRSDATVQQAIRNLDEGGIKIVMVVDEANKFNGTICDGDIRRGLLKGLDMNSPLKKLVRHNPFVVPPDMDRDTVMQLMLANKILQVPVVDESQHIVGLHLWEEITTIPTRSNLMVIMAGGIGKRLGSQTESCPKPLLPIAGKPMLEHIIERAKKEGFNRFIIAIHYLGEMIESYFGNGKRLGVEIDYLREKIPLGTAGALSLLNLLSNEPIIVTNGDVITDIRYAELLDFHIRHHASATMAVRQHEWEHPFGVVQIKGAEIVGFEEKPIARSHINAGVYVLETSALNVLNANTFCDMPTLFERLQTKNQLTLAYPMHEPWLDVGRPDDLITANSENKKG